MKATVKLYALALTAVLTLGLLGACTPSASPTPAPTAAPSAETTAPPAETTETETPAETAAPDTPDAGKEHVTIRYAQYGYTIDNTAAIKADPILNAIQAAVNANIELEGFSENYMENIEMQLTAGIAPDYFVVYDFEKAAKWMQDGALYDIGSVINADPARYPILHKIINSSEFQMYNAVYAGDPNKTYAIYSLASGLNWAGATLYHKDLMEAAGYAEPPKTVEEFVDCVTKIGASGVGGWWPRNNKLDRLVEIDMTLFAPKGTSMLAPGDGDPWSGFQPIGSDVEGPWKIMATSEETKEIVKVMAEMYAAGGIDIGLGVKDDFAEAVPDWQSGRIGAFNHGFSNYIQVRDFIDEAIAANPEKTWEDFKLGPLLEGARVYTTPYWMSWFWMVPSNCKNVERVLDFVEFMATDAGQSLLFDGVEGIHHSKVNGEIVYNEDAWLTQGNIYEVPDGRHGSIPFSYLFAGQQYRTNLETNPSWFNAMLNPEIPETPDTPLKEYINGVLDSYRDKVVVQLPAYFSIITYPTELAETLSQLKEITLRNLPAFVTGQRDIDAEWHAYVSEYEAAGAAQVEAAFNQALSTAKEAYSTITN
ncbi:MAG: extracellular solute-binding protein [Clostridiales bacterium]|jgi:hypothetical protein|nr:extracellular solute-binding protein [Clostridiales bacterium]